MKNEAYLDLLFASPYLNLLEAGGDCAYSTFGFLPERIHNKVVAIDDRKAALLWWHARGFHTSELPFEGILLPTDEFTRIRNDWMSPFSIGDIHKVHNKTSAYNVIRNASPKSVSLPEKYEGVVARGNNSSGSKGTQILDNDLLLTELIEGDELVVDVNSFTRTAYPRVTHDIRGGRDTFCTLLGQEHDLYNPALDAAFEVVDILGIQGIANVQLIASDLNGYYPEPRMHFVEAAMRLSGSSWLNAQVGANPLLGIAADRFHSLACNTKCGVKGWFHA